MKPGNGIETYLIASMYRSARSFQINETRKRDWNYLITADKFPKNSFQINETRKRDWNIASQDCDRVSVILSN